MLIGKLVKTIYKTTKSVIKNVFINIFNPRMFCQNVKQSIKGLKPKQTKTKQAVDKSVNIVKKANDKLLILTDKCLALYDKYISGKPKKIIQYVKKLFNKVIELIKKICCFIVAFYKKDKKRAIIYFILLYIVYKAFFGILDKIGNLFVSSKNELIVLTREVKPERVKKEVNCYGYLESENNLTYLSEVRGNIDKIFVKEKQMVKEGQLLMVLDSKFTTNAYTSAKSILESKKFQYNAIKKLYEDGLESKGNLKAMEADFENANSNFESAKKAYNGLMIRAPFDGFIDNINNKEGAQINPGQMLFTLERTDAMQVKCEVQNLNVDEVKIGDETRIFVGGYEMAKGNISVIGDSIDVYSGARSIVVNNVKAIEGFEEQIKTGTSVLMKIMAQAQKDVYKVSAEALEITPTGAFMVKVLNRDDNVVVAKDVFVYDENNGIDYVMGLTDGDYVIERGHEFVDVGDKDIDYQMVESDGVSFGKKIVGYGNKIKNFVVGVKDFVVDFPDYMRFLKSETISLKNAIVFKVEHTLFVIKQFIKNI